MAQLDRAAKRLQSALDTLERVVESRAAGAGEAELREALVAAQRENSVLQDAADTVATRLDKTITRLKATLES
jgi:ribosome-associated translation inhibitor RaiA